MHIWLIQRAESTPHDAGGTRRLMRMGILGQILQERGHRVTWWTSAFDHVSKTHRCQGSQTRTVAPGHDIHYVETRGYARNISLGRFLDNRSLTRNLRRDIALAETPDMILASLPSVELALEACRYGRARGVPVALDIRDLYPDVFRDLVPHPMRPLVDLASWPMRRKLRRTCAMADAILGITEGFVTWGVDHAGRPRGPDDQVFPMAYASADPSAPPDPGAQAFWADRLLMRRPDHLQVLFLGTFTNSFDFDTVLQSARLLQQQGARVCFTFCGTGVREDSLREQISGLDNCDLAGWVDAPQIRLALKQADIGLAPYIPSPNFVQNVPNKPAEYMSGGLALASSLTTGPLSDLLQDSGAGIRYGTDATSLASSLTALAEDSDQLQGMKTAASDLYHQRFSASRVYGAMANHLETLARSANKRPNP